MQKTNAVGWFDIYVSDMKRATSFYENVFNQKLEKMIDPTGETEMMSFPANMEVYGASGALVKSSYAKPGVGGTMLYFGVEDCANEEKKILPAGGKVIRGKFSIGEFGFVSIGQDTEGNRFGLNSRK